MMIDKQDREDRRRAQREGVGVLEASGVLNDLYARIDAGEIQLEGSDGLIQQLIKAGLERGLQAELSDHLGYDKGDPDAVMFTNSRNGSFPKTVPPASETSSWRFPETGRAVSPRCWSRRAPDGCQASMT